MIAPDQPPSPREIAEHYNTLGDFYREVWGDRLHHGYWINPHDSTDTAIQNLENTVIDLAGISPGDRVLDIGSGYGAMAIQLARRFGAEVSGWTLSERQHEVSVENASQPDIAFPKPTFHCADWMESDLPEASFDVVLSIECLSHIAEQRNFFRKAYRVLRPGGRLVISDWVAPRGVRLWQHRWFLGPICFEGRLAGLASLAEWIKLAEEAGLHIVETKEIGLQVRKTWLVITSRLIQKIFSEVRYRRLLRENLHSDRIFALTIARLLIAYHTGALDYGIIGFEKSKVPRAGE